MDESYCFRLKGYSGTGRDFIRKSN